MSSVIGKVSAAIRRAGLPVWKTRKLFLRNTPPIVSFSFDDFPRSALTIGGAILQNYNARGTYYAAMGLIGITNHQGEHFRLQDLHDLLNQGHELGSHSHSHISGLKTPSKKFHEDVFRGESEVTKVRSNSAAANSAKSSSPAGSSAQSGSGAGNFAYPFGDLTFGCKAVIGAQMRSCRGIRGGVMAGFADLNLLLANRLYSKSFDLSFIERLVQENQRRRGWLIFYTHDVRENPSDYGCTPSQYEAVVRAASRSGAHLLTVSQTLDAIQSAN